MKPLLALANSPNKKDQLITADNVKTIFGSSVIEVILGVHLALLQKLEVRLTKWNYTQKIGDIFMGIVGFVL